MARVLTPVREIEREVTAAVQKVKGCEGFKGVFVQRLDVADLNAANWKVDFADFGTANESHCKRALATAVAALQSQFDVRE